MNMLSVSDAEMLVNAFMTSRLDYCNALLGGCPVVPRIAKSPKRGRNFHICLPDFNSLPDNIRGSDTLSLFKSRLKTHLFSQAFI